MSSFTSEYERLNPEQRSAVDTIEGPVMVVAGPGTGKTQVLAMRVANVLRKTHAKPGNILCLTFSTSGATAMRERLRHLIGPDAYGICVSTMHGFANDIIASHPIVFDDFSAFEQISDIERYRQVNKIIDQLLPHLVLVNKKSPFKRTKDILGRISTLKREGKTGAAELRSIADQYEADLSVQSREGTKAHEKNLLSARKFREFVEIFLRYQAMLQETQRYDYDDMILFVLRALQEHDWLLAEMQERYQYILVDEFQDTNGAQYQLIELLTMPRTPEDKPNLFVVGDDDQAIYRFQGANLANILRFKERFTSAPVIVLGTSYRCTQSILDAASSLIDKNSERLIHRIPGLTKELTASTSEIGMCPRLLFSPSDMMEPWLIADLIGERIAQGIAPNDIAVLTQTNAELRPIYDVLRSRGIPVEMTGKVDLLMHPLVSQVIAILSAVHDPYDSGKYAAAIATACFGCHPADLGRIFAWQRERKASLASTLLALNAADGSSDPIVLHDRAAVLHARDVLLDLHQKLPSRTLVETLERVMKESGVLQTPQCACQVSDSRSPLPEAKSKVPKTRCHLPHDPLDFAALQEFFDRMKLRCYEMPHYSFEAFISDLEFYAEPEYGDLRLTYELPHLTDAGVQLMTAHRSKGLEFHAVILANFRDRHWDHRYQMPSISLPEDLLFGWEKEQKSFEKAQDERRVAFVAMTRAKRELIFTCPKQLTSGSSSRTVSPSAFFAEAGTLAEEEVELRDPENASILRLSPARFLDEEFKSFLRRRLQDFSLSVTALNHFLDDPQMFLESDLLQTPQSKESSLVYGNAVHDALRKWAMATKEGKGMDVAGFLSSFRKYLDEREVLTEKERMRLQKLGEESLPRYYQQRLTGTIPIIGKIEYSITTHLKDIPIKGKIDRIDHDAPDSARVSVIDFKTGRPKTDSQIRDEGYFRQLVFYSLLLKHGMPYLEPQRFILDFVGEGSEHPVLREYEMSDEDRRELLQVIEAVWTKIVALDFTRL